MLKIVACRCLLKNFNFHKYLKYAKFSSGSENDQNDNDKSDNKSKNNETKTAKTDPSLKDLESLFNNLITKNDSSQRIKVSQKNAPGVNRNIKKTNKSVLDNMELQKENTDSDYKEFKELLKSVEKTVIFAKLKDNNKQEMTESDSIKLKEVLSKTLVKGDVNKSSPSIKKEDTDPDFTQLKEVLSKSVKENVGFTKSKENIKKAKIESDSIKLRGILSKLVMADVNKSDSSIREENTDPYSQTQMERLSESELVDQESNTDFEKSPNSMSLENFKNLLSSCKVDVVNKIVDKKGSLENEMSVPEYLKSILQIDFAFKDYKMENNIKPFSIGKQDTKEDLIKLINEIVIGDTVKVTAKFDSSEKSFISMSVPTMRLNIFKKTDSEIQTEKESITPIIDLIESYEYRKMNSNVPSSYFHECIQLTRDKIMRNFPIDNDQDSEELNVGFHEHVFPQQYLTGKLSNTGVIGQYMNYVCMGLSQNPHLTIERKKAHIKWYEDYLSNKQEEIELATKKSIDDLEYEKALRNK